MVQNIDQSLQSELNGLPHHPSPVQGRKKPGTVRLRKRPRKLSDTWGDLFWQLIYADWSPADIGAWFGLTEEKVKRTIGPALFADHVRQPIPEIDGGVWCDQCDRRVFAASVDACASPFCKAKAMAAQCPASPPVHLTAKPTRSGQAPGA